mgnify:CR=1 FL=1
MSKKGEKDERKREGREGKREGEGERDKRNEKERERGRRGTGTKVERVQKKRRRDSTDLFIRVGLWIHKYTKGVTARDNICALLFESLGVLLFLIFAAYRGLSCMHIL